MLHYTCSMQATRLARVKQHACILLTETESLFAVAYGMHLLAVLEERGVTWADGVTVHTLGQDTVFVLTKSYFILVWFVFIKASAVHAGH